MATSTADTLTILLGSWTISRRIEDRRDGSLTRFDGTAEVKALADDPDRARYVEEGTVRRGAHHGPARRHLALERLTGGGVRFDFSDGRPFIDIDLRGGAAQAQHPCRADVYHMSFTLAGADRLIERWEVQGPEKDYVAETVWQRRAAHVPASVPGR